MSEDDTRVARPTALYPPPEINPREFEEFVAEQLLGGARAEISNLVINLRETVAGTDGTYEFDATARYEFAGMSFLVLVEAKLHRNPIKREQVQVLYQKIQSVGAHKGVIVATSPYQVGAVDFAKTHGIALVTVTEGRFVFETRDTLPARQLSREEAASRLGLPAFIAHCYISGGKPGVTQVLLLAPDDEDYSRQVAELLLGQPGQHAPPADRTAGHVTPHLVSSKPADKEERLPSGRPPPRS